MVITVIIIIHCMCRPTHLLFLLLSLPLLEIIQKQVKAVFRAPVFE
jgi:hypothetical protein